MSISKTDSAAWPISGRSAQACGCQTGSTARCAWRGLEGQKVFIVMDGQPLEEGVLVNGEIIGGTEELAGITGAFTFTWTSVFINEDTDTLTGHTENISGTYRLP